MTHQPAQPSPISPPQEAFDGDLTIDGRVGVVLTRANGSRSVHHFMFPGSALRFIELMKAPDMKGAIADAQLEGVQSEERA